MATKRRPKKIDVEAVLGKIERELRTANESKTVKKIEITLDVAAIHAGIQSGASVGICSSNVTDD